LKHINKVFISNILVMKALQMLRKNIILT